MRAHYKLGLFAVLLSAFVGAVGVFSLRPEAAADRTRDLSVAPPESVGVSSDRLRRLDAAMKRMVDEHRLAGVVTLMARKGRIVNFSAVGRRDVGKPDPMQKDSIFRIYSMTKPVTGVAMMMLFEDGKWRLDDPVSRYIPEFADLKVHAGENPDGSVKIEAARRGMTMRELMTHSAGLGYGLNETNPVDKLYRERRVLDSGASLQSLIEGVAKLPLIAHPGTRWYYSIAVDVQGYLVEKLSGQPFDEFLRRRIFDPLGMKDTSFYVPKEKLGRLALVHGEEQDGRLAVTSMGGDPTLVPKGPSGGGGLFSTAEDYARFCQMLLNGGEWNGARLLAPRTVAMMRTNHLRAEPLKTMRAGTGFGMDFAVVMDPADAGEPYSEGTYYWAGAAGTWFWIDPVDDFSFVGMIQHRGRAVADVQGVSRNLTYQAILD